MTVEQAIQALKDNDDKIADLLPAILFEQTPEETASALRSSRVEKHRYVAAQSWVEPNQENYQNRSNEEWEQLVAEEDDPLEAASLVWEWIQDKTQASVKMDGDIEVLASGQWLTE